MGQRAGAGPEGRKNVEKLLAIVTEDAVYGRALGDYMTGTQLLEYSVRSFYSPSDYLMFRDENMVSVLLADEESLKNIPGEGESSFLLSSVKDPDSKGIYMYQAFDLIVRELLFKLHDKKAGNVKGSRALSVFAAASGRGGSGVSTLSLCLARAMKQEGNTLFISLDPFYEPPCGNNGRENGRLSELIVELRLQKNLWMDEAERFIRHGRDFDFISGVYSYEDLYFLGREEMRLLFSGLSADARYKNVVFDLGFLPPGSGVIAEKCEKLYVIGDEKEDAGRRLKEQLRFSSGISEEQLAFVSLPFDKALSGVVPEYAVLESSEMSAFAETLVAERKKKMSMGGDERPAEKEKETKNALVLRESKGFGFVKGKFKRIAEKGFSEGFGG